MGGSEKDEGNAPGCALNLRVRSDELIYEQAKPDGFRRILHPVPRPEWYLGLKAALGGVGDVNWHSEKSFHITAAFIEHFLHPNEAYNAQDRVV